jgi:hypothetical protein
MNGIPYPLASELGNMSRLQDFVATRTWMVGSLPIEIYSISSLERLILSSTKLTITLLSRMYHSNGNMPTLTILDLNHNALNIIKTTILGSLPYQH